MNAIYIIHHSLYSAGPCGHVIKASIQVGATRIIFPTSDRETSALMYVRASRRS